MREAQFSGDAVPHFNRRMHILLTDMCRELAHGMGDNLEAVVLVGSYGRGVGETVSADMRHGSGMWSVGEAPADDIDLVLLVTKRYAGLSEEASQILERYGSMARIRVDLIGIITPKHLRNSAKLIPWQSILRDHQVLYGSFEIVDRLQLENLKPMDKRPLLHGYVLEQGGRLLELYQRWQEKGHKRYLRFGYNHLTFCAEELMRNLFHHSSPPTSKERASDSIWDRLQSMIRLGHVPYGELFPSVPPLDSWSTSPQTIDWEGIFIRWSALLYLISRSPQVPGSNHLARALYVRPPLLLRTVFIPMAIRLSKLFPRSLRKRWFAPSYVFRSVPYLIASLFSPAGSLGENRSISSSLKTNVAMFRQWYRHIEQLR